MATAEQWHQFEALRDDGAPARFRIRDMEPRLDQPKIFVVELPYPILDLSRLPDATSYRRITTFEQDWLIPAAAELGWTFVAAKIDDGSCFLYLYGSADSAALVARLAPFDGSLGFFDEDDPRWDEYGALKELLAEANAIADEQSDNAITTVIPVVDDASATIVRPRAEIEAAGRGQRPASPTIPMIKSAKAPPAQAKRTARGTAGPATRSKAGGPATSTRGKSAARPAPGKSAAKPSPARTNKAIAGKRSKATAAKAAKATASKAKVTASRKAPKATAGKPAKTAARSSTKARPTSAKRR